MLVSAFASARPDRFAWPDRKWEWVGLVPGTIQFETPMGLDMEARERWFAQAIVTSPAMFSPHRRSWLTVSLGHRDNTGAYLDGGKITNSRATACAQQTFLVVTAYNASSHGWEVQTDQDKAALSSLLS